MRITNRNEIFRDGVILLLYEYGIKTMRQCIIVLSI